MTTHLRGVSAYRATALLVGAVLIGGVGCYTAPSRNVLMDQAPTAETLRQLEARAAQGDARAMGSLGPRYLYGLKGLPPDRDKGLEYLRQAAQLGCKFPDPFTGGNVLPHISLANTLRISDPAQSDLWRARGILHCGYGIFAAHPTATINNATQAQIETEDAAWTLLASPQTSQAALRKSFPLADLTAAHELAARLGHSVRDSEREFPRPATPPHR